MSLDEYHVTVAQKSSPVMKKNPRHSDSRVIMMTSLPWIKRVIRIPVPITTMIPGRKTLLRRRSKDRYLNSTINWS